jgi:hypothetical protein
LLHVTHLGLRLAEGESMLEAIVGEAVEGFMGPGNLFVAAEIAHSPYERFSMEEIFARRDIEDVLRARKYFSETALRGRMPMYISFMLELQLYVLRVVTCS